MFDPETSRWHLIKNIVNPDLSPKARAGHSMTIIERRLFIIGGSYGQDYLRNIHVLDTDPPPDL